jgi:hypothetical protein
LKATTTSKEEQELLKKNLKDIFNYYDDNKNELTTDTEKTKYENSFEKLRTLFDEYFLAIEDNTSYEFIYK